MTLIPTDVGINVIHRMDGGPNRDGEGWGSFAWDSAPNVPDHVTWAFVYHTTETYWVPGYSGGVHPHWTYLPSNRTFYQHVRLDRRAGTLKGRSTAEGGMKVPTNRANVHQGEIVAYSQRSANPKYWVGDLTDDHLADLATFQRWHHQTYASPLVWYPYNERIADPMPHADWMPADGVREWGICDHGTAPDASNHWDSGALNRDRILELIGEDMPLSEADLEAIKQVAVEAVHEALGGQILMPPQPNDRWPRYGHQGIVNSVWHAVSNGRKLFETLNEIHDHTKGTE